METTTKKTTKKIGLVFGHKPDDMAHAITKMEMMGFEPLIVTWPRYEYIFQGHLPIVQPTPENQGMDCINLFLLSKDLAFKSLKGGKIGAVANCHTEPTLWDWDLTNKEWEKLFDFGVQKRYVKEIVEERYEELYGTKDSDEQDISGLTE